MPIGIALVLIFVLYLIDKHNRWRQAFKITIGLLVLGMLSVSGLFGWQKYETWQEARQEATREAKYEADQANQAAQKQAELAKTCKDWEDKHPFGSPPDKVYTEEGGLTEKLTNKHFWILDPPQGCEGPLEIDYNRNLNVVMSRPLPSHAVPANPSKGKPSGGDVFDQIHSEATKSQPPNCQAVVCSDWTLVVGNFTSIYKRCRFDEGSSPCGSFTSDISIASLRKNDRVQILSDKVRASGGEDIYEVKFHEWTGWMHAEDLSPETSTPNQVN